jgi:2-iminobutanoate/2-iminopropanoate deaminase
MRDVIGTTDAPASPLYSQAVRAGGFIFVSGLVGIDARTGDLAGANCRAVLEAARATLRDVVEVGVLLTNPADFAGMNEEYASWFTSEPPTRYVAKLGVELPGVLVSIRMTAFVG